MEGRSLFWYFVILFVFSAEIHGYPICTKSSSLLPCIVGMTKVMNFRLHIDLIKFFDEYITGRSKIIRKNDLTHQQTLLDNEQMTRNLQDELTFHKTELLNVENQYLNHQLKFWTMLQDHPLTQNHESWLENYRQQSRQGNT